ncbi:SpoIIE family protein phosphatase [Couchioplanes caeruleus]|uniref:SpoIIE family protein phosphatase n=1 Tax=Couchioplanes caeruleus TaxID=56438 RepID=UPI00201C5890|nr:SpoIIE family protein phosphatase [Couchioplanes caeruleus]UQU63826.1 SpoIIE family protein phosphatase [Couchioplanes caeruleus]
MAGHGDIGAPAQRALHDPARLRSLQRVCVSAESDAAFDRFAGLVKRLLGVPVALVSLVDTERQFFPGQVGLAEPWGQKRETPLSHSFCQHVVAEGVPKVFPDARIYAQVRDNLAIPDLGVVAYAGMPLKDSDGLTLGSLCAIDTKPRAWSKDELTILEDLAEACASELRLRIARDLAEEARRHAESAHDQLAMLAELTETFTTTLDMEEGMRRLAEGVTPRLADWCLVTLVDQNGAVRHVAAAHRDAEAAADVERFAQLMMTGLGGRSAVLAVQRSGQPIRRDGETADKILARTTTPELAEIAERLGYASFLIAPVTAPVTQRMLGSVTLVNGPGRPPFTEADERTALDIARRAGLAIDNSRLYGRQRHVAEVLQHSMLTELPDIPGMELHARYLPAQDGAAVGGDWYDAFAQPDGSVMLAVGDVSGHDIEAAAAMGQLRNLVRGDAYGRDDEPGRLLTQLDRAIRGLNVNAAATAVLTRIRRGADGYDVTFANAGHPPPLLLHPGGTVEAWWETPEPLLGLAPRAQRATHRRTVPAGSTLLLYTDGLVEDPGHLLDEGIDRVAETLRNDAARPGEELCTCLVETAARRADDIAFLLIRLL